MTQSGAASAGSDILRDAAKGLLGGEVGTVSFDAPEVLHDVAFGPARHLELAFRSSTGDRIPATYLAQPTRGPAILYCHAHGAAYDIGKSELLSGRPALGAPYGPVLAAAGYSVLCLEMPCFGARAIPGEGPLSKAHLWHGRTLFGRMLAEQVAGLDWLCARPELDATRVATMGLSMGGTLAWWLAALDRRFAAAVSAICLADMATLIDTGAHDVHGPYMTVPGLLRLASTGTVAGLAAPCPVLHCVGLKDPGTPPAAFEVARQDVESAYAASGAADAAEFHVEPDLDHRESPDMRRKALDFLARHLSREKIDT